MLTANTIKKYALTDNAIRALKAVGLDADETVERDALMVRNGDAAVLLDACLNGADAEAAACWREYVSALEVAVG
jgi:hypothetical protein